MLAVLYLIVAFVLGFQLLKYLLPWVLDIRQRTSLAGTAVNVPSWMIRWPAAWLLGALFLNWTTFIVANLARNMHTGSVMTLIVALVLCVGWISHRYSLQELKPPAAWWRQLMSLEGAYLFFAVLISSFIAWYTLIIHNGQLYVGNTVWSDFGPHLAVIRSFSMGENFPPQYPHFPEGNIRYHFLFQFLVATLERLGLPLDWAFNVPSILSLVSVFMLLYVLAVTITGSRAVGVLTGIFFIFRSSFAFFTFAKDHLDGSLWSAIVNVSLHIGKTQNESWGLWAQNVYANQRHFAFSIGIMLLILLALLPLLQKMLAVCGTSMRSIASAWLEKDSWLVADWRRALTLGFLLGAIGFWNGAVVITALIVLAVMALFCRNRLEFLVIAVLAVAMSMLESRWFIGAGASAVKPTLFFGFLAEHKTLAGLSAFLLELLGIFVPLFIVAMFGPIRRMGMSKGLALAFITPLVFAVLVSLTTDINANHKFIMVSVMLANILIAALIVYLWKTGAGAQRALAVIFTGLMTVTGLVDLLTLYNMNKGNVLIQMDDPVASWIKTNTAPKDVFLTDWSVLHAAQFAGRPIYYGWPYYAWSAGYDTETRSRWWKRMYSTTSPDELRMIARGEQIKYIVIDNNNRGNKEYVLNEALIAQTFPLVFSHQKDGTMIYRVE